MATGNEFAALSIVYCVSDVLIEYAGKISYADINIQSSLSFNESGIECTYPIWFYILTILNVICMVFYIGFAKGRERLQRATIEHLAAEKIEKKLKETLKEVAAVYRKMVQNQRNNYV